MNKEARISSRIDPKLKKQGNEILEEIGIKPSQAITMLYAQIVSQGGLPFDAKIPKKSTVKALEEDLSKKKRYNTAAEVMADLK